MIGGGPTESELTEWPYWSLDLPGLTQRNANRLLVWALEQRLSAGGSVLDPFVWCVRYSDEATVRSLVRACELAMGTGQLGDEHDVTALLEDLREWLATATAQLDDDLGWDDEANPAEPELGPVPPDPAHATIDHYLRSAYGDPAHPDFQLAWARAGANVHEPIQRDLAAIAPVQVLPVADSDDVGCSYRLSLPDGRHLEVHVSASLPYGAVVEGGHDEVVRYVTETDDSRAGHAVAVLLAHRVWPLTAAHCRALSPVMDERSGARGPMTYFQALIGCDRRTP